MNRAQTRLQNSRSKRHNYGFKPHQIRAASRISEQAYICRYMEDGWPDLEEFFGFRGFVDPRKQVDYYNLALALPHRWQAVAIVFLRDNWGKRYRHFGLAKTSQAFKGIGEGITPLINAVADRLEADLNSNHIYGRAVVFSPYSERFNSLIPVLRREKQRLRLTDDDINKVAEEESYESIKITIPVEQRTIEDEIAELLPLA